MTEEKPPVFQSWRTWYWLVLGVMLAQVIFYFLIAKIFFMSWIDWLVLFGTLTFIVLYGAWKTRGTKNMESYLKGDQQLKWWMVGVSIMATQASAVTFSPLRGKPLKMA